MSKKPFFAIQEIEAYLESYLQRKRQEIEKSLDEKIQKERELARQQLARIEEEIRNEWNSLQELKKAWEQVEEEGQRIVEQIKEYLQRIARNQKEIENLARATSEDIKTINQLQERLEEIRNQSQEKAALLKKHFEEKFGLKTEWPEESKELVGLDLNSELEKLKKIKELLILESRQEVSTGNLAVEKQLELEEERTPEVKQNEESSSGWEEKMTILETKEEENPTQEEIYRPADLAEFYRAEPANSSGEIGYYQKEDKKIFEVEGLLSRIKFAVEEAKKLAYKLTFVTSAKEKFFLKQELISTQEDLRRYLQKILLLAEKKSFSFPSLTQDIFNQRTIEDLVDLLRVQNWASSEDLGFFEQKILLLEEDFRARTSPPSVYLTSIRKELEA